MEEKKTMTKPAAEPTMTQAESLERARAIPYNEGSCNPVIFLFPKKKVLCTVVYKKLFFLGIEQLFDSFVLNFDLFVYVCVIYESLLDVLLLLGISFAPHPIEASSHLVNFTLNFVEENGIEVVVFAEFPEELLFIILIKLNDLLEHFLVSLWTVRVIFQT